MRTIFSISRRWHQVVLIRKPTNLPNFYFVNFNWMMLIHYQLSRPFLHFYFEKKPEFMMWVLGFALLQSSINTFFATLSGKKYLIWQLKHSDGNMSIEIESVYVEPEDRLFLRTLCRLWHNPGKATRKGWFNWKLNSICCNEPPNRLPCASLIFPALRTFMQL